MAAADSEQMTLAPNQLNELDRWILDFLADHEWASVSLLRAFHVKDEGDVSRQWMSTRVSRLREHGHVRRVLETATYELADDPRD